VKFATYYRDGTTALDYANQRYYGRTIGRFLTADPYGGSANPANPQSWNRYAYVQGDPVNANDPSGLVPAAIYDEGLSSRTIVIQQVVWDGESLREVPIYLAQLAGPHQGKVPYMQRWERYEMDYGLSEKCARALVVGGATPANLKLANDAKSTLEEAAKANGVDWRMMAAIGVYESGFINTNEKDGRGNAVGIFQFANTSGVPASVASDPTAAIYAAAGMLAQNRTHISSKLPSLSQENLEWAMAASWNKGAQGVVNNITAGHTPDYHTSPIFQNGVIVGYRGGGTGQYGTDIRNLMDCFK